METEVLLLYSEEPATELCSKPDESGPHNSILFPPDSFEIIPPPTPASSKSVFLDRRAAARYRALASIIPDRERPEETTICYKISLVQLITNLYVILYLSTCHTVYISVLILFMIMT